MAVDGECILTFLTGLIILCLPQQSLGPRCFYFSIAVAQALRQLCHGLSLLLLLLLALGKLLLAVNLGLLSQRRTVPGLLLGLGLGSLRCTCRATCLP